MRAVIAEDLVLLRDGLARALTTAGITVEAQVGDAGALIDAVGTHRPDVAIVDIRMPPAFSDEGARATVFLRERYPALAILVLSHTVDPHLAMTLVGERPSGFGYLLKERVLDVDEFIDAVRTVAAGGTVLDADVIAFYLARDASRLGQLTPREVEVLGLIAKGASNAGIASRALRLRAHRGCTRALDLREALSRGIGRREPARSSGARLASRRLKMRC